MPCHLPSPGCCLVFWNLPDPQAAEARASYTARGVRAGLRRAHCWESPKKPSSFPFPLREGGQLWGQPRSGVHRILSLGGRRTREPGLAQSQVCLLRGSCSSRLWRAGPGLQATPLYGELGKPWAWLSQHMRSCLDTSVSH